MIIDKRLVCIFLLLFMLSSVASAVHIKSIETKPEEIDPNGEFSVIVYLGGTTCGTQMKVYIDDLEFASKNIGCGRDEVESDEWDLDKDPLDCGIHELRVDLVDAGSVIQSSTMDLKIGNVPDIIMSPKEPNPNAETTITFNNKDTGKPLVDLDVRVYEIREGVSSAKDYSTNSGGKISFVSDSIGEFRLLIESQKYCGTRDFWIKKDMPFAGPFPEDPVVGERIGVAVPSGVGVKYIDSEGNVHPLRNFGGGVNFTAEKAGDYTLVAGELSTIYWSVVKNFSISEKSRMSVKIEPEQPVTRKVVLLTVTSRGTPLENTPVKITKPIGGSETFETNANGEVRFTPENIGSYHYQIEKPRYEVLEGDFQVNNAFDLKVMPYEPIADQDITLNVTDQLDSRVENAMVYIEDSSGVLVTEKTGYDGSFRFRLPDPEEYAVKVQKEGYWDLEYTLKVYGVISLKLCPEEIEIGDEVSMSVTDKEGAETPAEITVILPTGRTETVADTVYKPEEVGIYEVTATKTDYRGVTGTFKVNPHPLEITADIEENNVIITATSHDEPVLGITVLLTTPTEEKQVVTDENGIVTALVEDEGNLTINANNIDKNENYEDRIITRKIVKKYDFILLLVPVLSVVLITFLAIIVIDHVHSGKGKKKGTGGLFHKGAEKKTSLRGKTSLQGKR